MLFRSHLRQGIHLRGYAQKNPKQEYKREAFQLFAQMLDLIRKCFPKQWDSAWSVRARELCPSLGIDLSSDEQALQRSRERTARILQLS